MSADTTGSAGTSQPADGSRNSQTEPGGSSGLRDKVGTAVDRGKSGIADSAQAAGDSLSTDVAQLQKDIAAIQQTLSKFASEAGGEALKTVQSVGTAVGAAASDVASAASTQVKTFASEVERMARANPLATVGASVLVGVIIGLLSRGGRS
jgi:ElaB/YqjD/DUF883 family membrane-anchored ribosome-binding protein